MTRVTTDRAGFETGTAPANALMIGSTDVTALVSRLVLVRVPANNGEPPATEKHTLPVRDVIAVRQAEHPSVVLQDGFSLVRHTPDAGILGQAQLAALTGELDPLDVAHIL